MIDNTSIHPTKNSVGAISDGFMLTPPYPKNTNTKIARIAPQKINVSTKSSFITVPPYTKRRAQAHN